MLNFHKIKLPSYLATQAVGSPMFATSLASTASGREARLADRTKAVQKYTISSCRLSGQQFEEFNAFFRARMGMQFSFLMRDYADCSLRDQALTPQPSDPTRFEIVKTYQDQLNPYERRITKVALGSVQLHAGGLDVRAIIDHDNGLVTLEQPLQAEQRLIINATFDVCVRFCSDHFKYQMDQCGSVTIDELELVEVL